ncbi:NAD(P)/FAD-dependent oxidoreductase [Effusibacillus lacus]|uniref:Thioredoxin-disulfide reductase n=1 Tax=Effusibacillus lacus TaxID=1348429 RepID=A0A292YL38_9BACL|nr:NAD(P)/FAD-dependent oxidoreductase [Effusibacillus lacus]TCS71259.1 thioredoxin reductase (NADPH) [Effusibacillus lacus]GAX89886.1 thioredoxin-disulfide reductase [Effusibacillus lacus]
MYDVAIVGGGPGGLSALVWCHRLGLKTILLERNGELGGQLFRVNNPIIDYLGIPAANGRELQERFVAHVKGLDCPYECGIEVREFDLQGKVLRTNKGEYRAKALILALGSHDRKLGVPGEAEMIDRKEVYSASRDKHRFQGKNVAVVGGGDRAVEGALLLAEHGAKVMLIHRSGKFRARKEYVQPVLTHPGVQVLTHSLVKEIVGQEHVQGIVVETNGSLTTIPVEAVFVRIGVEPDSNGLRGQLKMDRDGYVTVDEFGETSVRNVFAVGDLRTRPLFSSVAGSVAQGMIAAKTISYRIETGEEI